MWARIWSKRFSHLLVDIQLYGARGGVSTFLPFSESLTDPPPPPYPPPPPPTPAWRQWLWSKTPKQLYFLHINHLCFSSCWVILRWGVITRPILIPDVERHTKRCLATVWFSQPSPRACFKGSDLAPIQVLTSNNMSPSHISLEMWLMNLTRLFEICQIHNN